jgi:hypothetical protein
MARPHFDEDHIFPIVGDEVDFSAACADLPCDNSHTTRFQPVGGDPLAEVAEFLPLIHNASEN